MQYATNTFPPRACMGTRLRVSVQTQLVLVQGKEPFTLAEKQQSTDQCHTNLFWMNTPLHYPSYSMQYKSKIWSQDNGLVVHLVAPAHKGSIHGMLHSLNPMRALGGKVSMACCTWPHLHAGSRREGVHGMLHLGLVSMRALGGKVSTACCTASSPCGLSERRHAAPALQAFPAAG